ncbi:MAG: dihydroorotate dehydrogenase electron transfer subunit [Euryarchaeota archaeon RBG_13_57_23]|nr:MAG: dihydroorotate dehydrogenase electron transfer subunit [Euryarchaeota archaeon RBG_13_57_23]
MRFKEPLIATAGQFVMVWVPGVDEFPMSVSYTGDRCGITYQIIGEGTKALAYKKPGEKIGLRGPYGKGFSIRGKKLLFVGGGVGMAPLAPLVEMAAAKGASVDLVLGAKTRGDLLFESRSAVAGARVHLSTDDGSIGFKGLATELAQIVVGKQSYDCMYACGPEKMLAKLLTIATEKGIPMQASLERIIKCGIGICDSCAIDGKHVCRDGPVFSEGDLRRFTELGKSKLDAAGRKIPI